MDRTKVCGPFFMPFEERKSADLHFSCFTLCKWYDIILSPQEIFEKGETALNRKLQDEDMDILFRGILKLKTVDECYDFFEDLCTISELRAMVQRFQVARMLDEGRIYSDIVQETGASTATISRVNKCLVYGSDGYRRMLDRLKEDHE